VTYFKCYRTNPKTHHHSKVVAQDNQVLVTNPDSKQVLDATKINVEHQEILETKEKFNK